MPTRSAILTVLLAWATTSSLPAAAPTIDEILERAEAGFQHTRTQATISPRWRAITAALDKREYSHIPSLINQFADDTSLIIAAQAVQLDTALQPTTDEPPRSTSIDFKLLNLMVRLRLSKTRLQPFDYCEHSWREAWMEQVASKLGSREVITFAGIYRDNDLQDACLLAHARGDRKRAHEFATALAIHNDVARGVCFAEALIHDQPRAPALSLLIRGFYDDDYIELGGEECEACAEIFSSLIAQHQPPDLPAVNACYETILKFGKDYAEDDARSGGVYRAAMAAIQAARRDKDARWLRFARGLREWIWTESAQQRVTLQLARCEILLGNPTAAAKLVASVEADAFGGKEAAPTVRQHLLASNQEISWHGHPFDPLVYDLPLALSKTHKTNRDLQTILLQAAWAEARSQYEKQHLLAVALALDHPLSANEKWRQVYDHGTLMQAVSVCSQHKLNTLPKLLKQIQPQQCADGYLDEIVDVLNLEQHGTVEQALLQTADRGQRRRGLLVLALSHYTAKRTADARRCIELALCPPYRDAITDWQPYTQRGTDRDDMSLQPRVAAVDKPQEAFTAAMQVKDEDGKRLDALYKLAQRLAIDDRQQRLLRRVLNEMQQAKRGDDYGEQEYVELETTTKNSKLAHVHLLLGDADAALDLAVASQQRGYSGFYPTDVLMLASTWFRQHPNEFRARHAERYFRILDKAHPQDLPATIAMIVPQMLTQLPVSERQRFENLVLEQTERFRSLTADASVCHSALAEAAATNGQIDRADKLFAASITMLLADDSLYGAHRLVIGSMLRTNGLDAKLQNGNNERISRALLDVQRKGWRGIRTWEGAQLGWLKSGNYSSYPLLLQRSVTSEYREKTRRSWQYLAVRHAAKPVTAIWATFSPTPINIDQATEQTQHLLTALRKENRAEDAERLAQLLERHRPQQ